MTKLVLALLIAISGTFLFGEKIDKGSADKLDRARNPSLSEEKFDYSPASGTPYKKDVVMSYWLRCFRRATPVVSAIVQNDSDGSRNIPRETLLWSKSTKVQINVTDFQNSRTVAKASGWIEGKSTDISLAKHSVVGCSVPFSRLFPSVAWRTATREGYFMDSSYVVDGKQYKSSFMILDCSKLPETEVLESKCPD